LLLILHLARQALLFRLHFFSILTIAFTTIPHEINNFVKYNKFLLMNRSLTPNARVQKSYDKKALVILSANKIDQISLKRGFIKLQAIFER
jgi:hypothetical protein